MARFAALEAMITHHGGMFAFGDTPTFADCCLIPQVYSARLAASVWTLPPFRAFAPPMLIVPVWPPLFRHKLMDSRTQIRDLASESGGSGRRLPLSPEAKQLRRRIGLHLFTAKIRREWVRAGGRGDYASSAMSGVEADSLSQAMAAICQSPAPRMETNALGPERVNGSETPLLINLTNRWA